MFHHRNCIFSKSVALTFILLAGAVPTSGGAIASITVEPAEELPIDQVRTEHKECLEKITRRCVLDKALALARSVQGDHFGFGAMLAVAQVIDSNDVWAEVESATLTVANKSDRIERLTRLATARRDPQYFAAAARIARSFDDPTWRIRELALLGIAARDRALLDEALEGTPSASDIVSSPQIKPWVLFLVARGYVELGHFSDARELARRVQRRQEPDRRFTVGAIYSGLIAAQTRLGLFEDALATAREENEALRANNAGTVAQGFAKAGDFARALEVTRTLNSSRAPILSSIATMLAGAGRFDEAIAVLEEGGAGSHRDSGASQVVRALTKTGQYDRAVLLARTIDSSFYRSSALSDIAKGQGDDALFEDASKVLLEIQSDYFRDLAALHIVRVTANSGHFERAANLVRSITADLYRTQAIASIAEAKKDKTLFAEALAMARTIVATGKQPPALVENARVFEDRQLFVQACDIVRLSALSNSQELAVIAATHTKSGSYDTALEIVRCINKVDARANELVDIAILSRESGTIREALETVLSVRHRHGAPWQANHLARLAGTLGK